MRLLSAVLRRPVVVQVSALAAFDSSVARNLTAGCGAPPQSRTLITPPSGRTVLIPVRYKLVQHGFVSGYYY